MTSRFNQKKFVITGGSSGIGLATAERLIEEGARVLITGTNAEKLNRVKTRHPGVLTLINDAGDPAAASALADHVREHLGGAIDGVFLNAGLGVFTPHDQVSAAQFDEQYNVNVRGPLLQMSALSSLLRDGASVVFNTSVAQNVGLPGSVLYASTKGALRTATRVIARELAPRQIRVNAVSPGPVGSDFFDRTGMPEEVVAQMMENLRVQIPLGRFGAASEIAGLVAFLFSEDASFMTGTEIIADGGLTQL